MMPEEHDEGVAPDNEIHLTPKPGEDESERQYDALGNPAKEEHTDNG